MKKTTKFSVGDRVMYSSEFLRSIGVFTGEICFVIGEVQELDLVSPGHPAVLVTVKWVSHGPSWDIRHYGSKYLGTTSLVLNCNLEHSIWE